MQIKDCSVGKVINLTHVLAASFAGIIAESMVVRDQKIIPRLDKTDSGRVQKLEKFSHYVARQMGFAENEVPELCRLAHEYLIKPKECEENIYEYLAHLNDPTLYGKLIDEFDRCILSYFVFHWNQASYVISQVLSVESPKKIELKKILLAATRKQRFEIVTKNLKVARVFSTLVEEMKAISTKVDWQRKNDTIPSQSDRSPVLLLMGGGMGAGKSTVLKDILKESFWSEAASNVVLVEADAFKESDVIYRALNSRGHHHDMLQSAELVHQSSTDAASSLLVTALNEGRDVIMDGTLSWEPFVEQTIAMARNVHKYKYRMGVGYKVAEDGTVTENYWEQVDEAEEEHQSEEIFNGEPRTRKPYRIELVGVVCDGYLAVVRGIRRAIMTGRAVRVNSQLKSHKRFANSFPRYCKLVDNARLYCTNVVGGPPKLIWWKDGDQNLAEDPEDIQCLEMIGSVNVEADSIYELYKEHNIIMGPSSVWNDFVLSPSRSNDQKELRESIQKIEKSIRNR
ncbi:hypothetical protein Fmac_024174 [Flemingia macrophylla]|uniref:Zeta toxin domain-containing protein n=1 Tax=Flemingia macrophylla TaxID=520843 RepID=A0ABD1LNR6_9FABA